MTRAGADQSALDLYVSAVSFVSRIAGVVAAGLIGLAVFVVCDMVIERYFLNLTTVWQIDVVTYAIVAATFIGSSYVLLHRGHVNVDILPLWLNPRPRFWLAVFTMTLFPRLLQAIARALAVEVPSNALFALAILYLTLNVLSLTIGLKDACSGPSESRSTTLRSSTAESFALQRTAFGNAGVA